MKCSYRRATALVVLTFAGVTGVAGAATGASGPVVVPTVKGTKPMAGMPTAMAITPIGTASWQGMKIQARAMAPATFILLQSGRQQFVRPHGKDSFHLMVLLDDARSGAPIPYSSVWATITKGVRGGGRPVFDERLWPMISQAIGVHYGNNVALPTAGRYRLTLLISPPAVARHMEYDNRWLKPHKVSFGFDWIPAG